MSDGKENELVKGYKTGKSNNLTAYVEGIDERVGDLERVLLLLQGTEGRFRSQLYGTTPEGTQGNNDKAGKVSPSLESIKQKLDDLLRDFNNVAEGLVQCVDSSLVEA